MTEITILSFGIVAEIIGQNSFTLTHIPDTTALIMNLETTYPSLKQIPYAIAVNKKMITAPVQFTEAATVALLPPFSGG